MSLELKNVFVWFTKTNLCEILLRNIFGKLPLLSNLFLVKMVKGFYNSHLDRQKKSHRPIVLIPIHCLGLFSEIHDLQENKFTLCISIIKDTMKNFNKLFVESCNYD